MSHETRSRRGSKTTVIEVKCGTCNSPVTETPTTHDEKSVECDCCNKWYHTGCAKISEAVYTAIDDSEVTWYCPPCKGGASKLKTLLVGLENEQQRLRSDMWSSNPAYQNSYQGYILLCFPFLGLIKPSLPVVS